MNIRSAILLIGASMMLALPVPGSASHEPCWEDSLDCTAPRVACRRGQGWVATPEVDTTQVGGSNYVDVDSELMPDPFLVSIWIYEETNGVAGLQRADTSVDTTCAGHLGVGDTIVF